MFLYKVWTFLNSGSVPLLKEVFANVLRSRGVEVLYLDQLAAEAIDSDEFGRLREQFVDDMLGKLNYNIQVNYTLLNIKMALFKNAAFWKDLNVH